MDQFGDFDDGLFEQKRERSVNENALNEAIRSYLPKQVLDYAYVNEAVSNENDEHSYVMRLRGDHFYSIKEFEKAIQHYQLSLESYKTSGTSFQREINESIALCLIRMKKLDEAEKIVNDLKATSQNYETYTSALSLSLNLFDSTVFSNDLMINVCKLITMHPVYIKPWLMLGDQLRLAEPLEQLYHLVYQCIQELYARNTLNQPKNELILKQNALYEKWLEDNKPANLTPLDTKFIQEKFEMADSLEDNEKMARAKQLESVDDFKSFWFIC